MTPRDYVSKIRDLITRLPSGSEFVADEKLASDFFLLSEDPSVPATLRDFCIDLSLRARAIETGPLALRSPGALLGELEARAREIRTDENA